MPWRYHLSSHLTFKAVVILVRLELVHGNNRMFSSSLQECRLNERGGRARRRCCIRISNPVDRQPRLKLIYKCLSLPFRDSGHSIQPSPTNTSDNIPSTTFHFGCYKNSFPRYPLSKNIRFHILWPFRSCTSNKLRHHSSTCRVVSTSIAASTFIHTTAKIGFG